MRNDILKVIKKQNWGASENFGFEKKNCCYIFGEVKVLYMLYVDNPTSICSPSMRNYNN